MNWEEQEQNVVYQVDTSTKITFIFLSLFQIGDPRILLAGPLRKTSDMAMRTQFVL